MAIFALASVTGAPGVTTTALGLALAWPRDVVLVDADRCASQALLTGYLAVLPTGGRGLTSLTQSYRDGIVIRADLPSHLVPILGPPADGPPSRSDGRAADDDVPGPQRWFLPGFARPGSSELFDPIWPEVAAALADLDQQGVDVVMDCGRWGAHGPPAGIIQHARWLGLVTRSTLRSLAALRLYAPDVSATTAAAPQLEFGLVVVGTGWPYGAAEIAVQFGWPVLGEIPWQQRDAAVLSDGARARRKAHVRPLQRSYTVLANRLRDIGDRWDAQVLHRNAAYAMTADDIDEAFLR